MKTKEVLELDETLDQIQKMINQITDENIRNTCLTVFEQYQQEVKDDPESMARDLVFLSNVIAL